MPDHPTAVFCQDGIAPDLDLLAMHDAWPERYPFLLESADGHSGIARYDILLLAGDEQLSLDSSGKLQSSWRSCDDSLGFLENLNNWQNSAAIPEEHGRLFCGGWFIYLGYELAGEIEPSLQLNPPPGSLPAALAVRCPGAIVVDRHEKRCWAVAESEALLATLMADFQTVPARRKTRVSVRNLLEAPTEDYLLAVNRIREYIFAGDVFQVNLSRPWQGEIPVETADSTLYQQLREANPAPFSGLMRWGNSAIISSSPERLVEVRHGEIQTRPIAGTRPRRYETESDDDERSSLAAHPKERAEHIMLIDLERNDLGRICEPGSIEVNELMVLESYTHVHHIVSNVRGRLRENISAGDVIRAVFPGGTITGCPKVRCMEIISELETEGRGYYTGAMGYLNRDGSMDMNILIRCLEREQNKVRFRTGAGIVADSIAENELLETRAKARGLLKALNAD